MIVPSMLIDKRAAVFFRLLSPPPTFCGEYAILRSSGENGLWYRSGLVDSHEEQSLLDGAGQKFFTCVRNQATEDLVLGLSDL